MGPTRRYVCIETDNPAGEVLQLETRSSGRSPGCIQSRLDQPPGKGLYQPSLESGGQSAEQSPATETTLVLIAPVWKSQPWYPTLLQMLVAPPPTEDGWIRSGPTPPGIQSDEKDLQPTPPTTPL